MSRPRPHVRHLRLRPLSLATCLVLSAIANAQELPAPDAVALRRGAATITDNGTAMTVNQTTAGAVIHWRTFSIGATNTVTFQQPAANSVALNRVVGGLASNIAGALSANGRIFLVNPSGVVFGAGSQVNVGGLVASTLDIADDAFEAGIESGNFAFTGASTSEGQGVVVEGTITTTPGGTVALLSPDGARLDQGLDPAGNVVSGRIVAPGGSVLMGNGVRMTLDFEGDGLTQIVIDEADTSASQVRNNGSIEANGGQIVMLADGITDGQLGQLIVNTGVLRANTLANRAGRIVLDAGGGEIRFGGNEAFGGVAEAIGVDAGQQGGIIDINARQVQIRGSRSAGVCDLSCSVIDASGDAGAGTIDIHAAENLAFEGGNIVQASAGTSGNGGNVRLTAGIGARIYGELSARGGSGSGNGGLIETSAPALDVAGASVDASAANGLAGSWLIDPFDVDIVDGAGTGVLPGDPFVPVAATTLQDADINAALDAGTSVRITTGAVAAGGANDGDIRFVTRPNAAGALVSPVIQRSTGTAPLTFQLDANRAIHSVEVNSDGTEVGQAGFSIIAGGGPLNVLFNANANNTAVPSSNDAGIVLFDFDIGTNGGNLWFYGQNDPVGGLAGGEEEGIELTLGTIDTRAASGNGGEVRLRAIGGDSGVELVGTSIQSGTGAMSLFGRTVFSGPGVILRGFDNDGSPPTRSLLQSNGGNIAITGLALQSFSGSTQVGVDILDASVLADGGNIDVFGRATGIADAAAGTTAMGVRLGTGAQVGNALTLRTRLVGESADSGGFQSGLEIESGCGNAGACIGGDVVVLQAGTSDGSQAIYLDGTVQANSVANLRPGGVDANGIANERAADPITVGGSAGGFSLGAGVLANVTAPQLVLGSNGHVGLIDVQAALTRAGSLTLQNQGAGSAGIALNAAVNVGANTLALLSSGNISQTAAGTITAGSLLAQSSAGAVALSTASNNVSGTTLAGSAAGDFSYTDVDALTIGTVNAAGFDAAGNNPQAASASGVSGSNVFVRNLAGDMTLNAGASAGNLIDLVTAGRLQNPGAATLSAGNRWRVWADTWIGESRGGLAGSGPLPNLYNCSFAGACGVVVPAADNHFIYRQQPTASVTVASAAREYGLDNPAFSFTVAGLVLGDLAANAINGTVGTSATILSNVGSYPIDGTFTSPAGYAISLFPGTLLITPATLTFVANPSVRFVGQPNGTLGGVVIGFRNADTLAGATDGTPVFTSPANESSPIGRYPIDGSGLSAINYVFVQAPENATALLVSALPGTLFAPDLVREPPDNYLYDRNIGSAQLCMVTDTLASTEQKAGDNLAREWSRVRSRPNLTNCVQTNKRYGCSDF